MDQRALTRSLHILAKRDDALKEALAVYGKPAPRQRPEGFETFVNTVVAQHLLNHPLKLPSFEACLAAEAAILGKETVGCKQLAVAESAPSS